VTDNGIAALSVKDIIAKATSAIAEAPSARIKGLVNGQSLDALADKTTAKISLVDGAATLDVITIDSDVSYKGNAPSTGETAEET
jgi:hypothetical protein